MLQEVLSLSDDALVVMDSHFLLSGGDSLRSLRLCDDITASVGGALPGLLEVVLSGSFADLLNHVATATLPHKSTQRPPDHPCQDPLPPTHTTRKRQDPLPPMHTTRKHQDPLPPMHTTRKQPDPLPPTHTSRKQPDPLPPTHITRKQPNGLPPSCEKRLKQQDGFSSLVRFTVVRRAGEIRELHLLSQKHNPLLNTVSHTAAPNERADHAHSHNAGPNERADHCPLTHRRAQ